MLPLTDAQPDFLHFLRGVVVLLGCRVDVADKLEHLEAVTASDVDALRQYHIDLTDGLKSRLDSQSTISVRVGRPE